MNFELRQQLKQGLVMTHQLQQAIGLLQLSRQELVEAVHQELLENPFLEERGAACAEQEAPGAELSSLDAQRGFERAEGDSAYDKEVAKDEDWESYIGDFSSSPKDAAQREVLEEESTPVEARYAEKPTLSGHLLWQLHLSNLSQKEIEIGEAIIGNLSSMGYLTATLSEIASMTGADERKIESVLRRVQFFDPPGVAARNVAECLLVQIKERGMDSDPLLVTLVRDHLEDLEARRIQFILKRCHIEERDLYRYVDLIKTLNPAPGSSFGGGEVAYVSPDVYVLKAGNDFIVTLNDDGLPDLSVLDEQSLGLASCRATAEEKRFCLEKKRAADWLVRSLHQRRLTLRKVMESIVAHQREFFENGVKALKPLVLHTIAEDIGVHESTVSRVTSNKYVSTPHGIFEIKYFFNSAIAREDGSEVGSQSVKLLIKKLIDEEDPRSPVSDDYISGRLQEELGFTIARRTVAKYRTVLGIPTSLKRKRRF